MAVALSAIADVRSESRGELGTVWVFHRAGALVTWRSVSNR